MTSIIYRLDIALAAPKKSCDFLDERKKGSRNDKLAELLPPKNPANYSLRRNRLTLVQDQSMQKFFHF